MMLFIKYKNPNIKIMEVNIISVDIDISSGLIHVKLKNISYTENLAPIESIRVI